MIFFTHKMLKYNNIISAEIRIRITLTIALGLAPSILNTAYSFNIIEEDWTKGVIQIVLGLCLICVAYSTLIETLALADKHKKNSKKN